ncbi:aspartate/glutamate racemase family protein [Mongoliitalea daihaiensis]|uniref:aspartate/glutamate racemase family protein n=1 Tax=Mongoliitalea daihaiensis TaxID=2782006 RepID=UPI001F277032|nr:amino acid racemase [Mongoliitalea daihaiensis]UJP63573.1 amino acid racemase [Mongoliitalea daihaiensis]
MKLLGLIGGTSWHSTIEYYRLINEYSAQYLDVSQNPNLLIYSQNIQLMREQDIPRINKAYLEIAHKLESAGAEAIVICANTPHMVYNYVQPKISIPILHIGEAIGREAASFSIQKLGLLANKPTSMGTFIPDYLQHKFGIETVLPKEDAITQSHQFISKELTQGIFSEQAKEFYLEQIQLLSEAGAEGVILGCTELPLLITQEESPIRLISTTQLHAQLAVDFIFGK